MKKFSMLLIAVVISFILAACSDSETGGDGKPEVYKIGAIYSNTGPASPLGTPEWNTTELLVKQINDNGGINGVPIEVILADDESTPEKAIEEMNRLINDENVIAVLGTTTTGPSLAMKGIAMDNEVPVISAGASIDIVTPVEESTWVFKTPQSDALAVERVYMYLQESGMTKIGILADSNAYGESGVKLMEELKDEYDIEIVAKESYNTEDADMKTQLTKINSSDAQAVVVWGTNPGPAIAAKNMKELGMDLPYIGSHGIANQSFLELAGDAAEGVVIPTGKLLFPKQIPESDPQYEVINKFYDDYVAEFDSEPTNFGSYGYDNLMILVEALKNGATDRESIRDYLENNIKDFVGATGVFNFSPDDHNGLTADSLVLAEVKDGKWVYKE
ncbi:ABC transporter substrate-binding protein [Bacillus litorisediminis]|uniref:ABC transporter substrate-binding protein n=1 Tax=Bacillus litorisediminis TaxID=2922713 RepID=UPI001FAE4D73|nr:ABC transporter substrate-binding protein [Bacillus litorisediminis]